MQLPNNRLRLFMYRYYLSTFNSKIFQNYLRTYEDKRLNQTDNCCNLLKQNNTIFMLLQKI